LRRVFSGILVTTTGKFSVEVKPPHRGVKESDVGGEAGKKIARLGIKAVVLEDLPEKPTPRVLTIASNELRLLEFPESKRKFVSETILLLRERFGREVGIICIGPAGEMKMAGAGVAVSDVKRHRCDMLPGVASEQSWGRKESKRL
jgi:aldehyde:ferredoxin oxidoreductase